MHVRHKHRPSPAVSRRPLRHAWRLQQTQACCCLAVKVNGLVPMTPLWHACANTKNTKPAWPGAHAAHAPPRPRLTALCRALVLTACNRVGGARRECASSTAAAPGPQLAPVQPLPTDRLSPPQQRIHRLYACTHACTRDPLRHAWGPPRPSSQHAKTQAAGRSWGVTPGGAR